MPFIVCYIVHETFLVEIFRRQFQRLTEISVPCSLDHGKWVTMVVRGGQSAHTLSDWHIELGSLIT